MNGKKIRMEVTEQEADLLQMIRNYVNSYPNGYPDLLDAAQQAFDDLVDPFKYSD